MYNRSIILLFFMAILSIGCDILGILKVENFSDSTIYFTIHPNHSCEEMEKIELAIEAKKEKVIPMGFGYRWTDEQIRDYISLIDRIEIVTIKDTTIISEQGDLFLYFKKRKKGVFRETIKINVE